MTRYRRPEPEPNWMLEGIDKYLATTDPHRADYRPQSRYTGPDYRQVKAQELDLFPEKITRIDLVNTEHGPVKRCWRAGWMPGDRPRAADVAALPDGLTVEAAADKLEAQGWKVRRWPGGARAWRIAPRPVRTGDYANKHRERLLANPPAALAGRVGSYDKYLDL